MKEWSWLVVHSNLRARIFQENGSQNPLSGQPYCKDSYHCPQLLFKSPPAWILLKRTMTLWMGPKPENGLSRLTRRWSPPVTRLSRSSGEKNSRKKLLKGNTKSPECAVDDSGVRSRFLHIGFFSFYIIARRASPLHNSSMRSEPYFLTGVPWPV